jgi:FKBP-type peptidyl-prolyl cis-trans isomerase
MNKHFIAGLVLTGMVAPLMAQDAPTSQQDKISYSIGADIGKNFKKMGIEINPAMLAKGISDVTSGGKTALTDEEMQKTLQTFQSELQAKAQERQKAAAEKNKATGEAFLAANKSKDGVKTTSSGLQYKVVTEGKGPKPKASDTVKVNYRGTLVDGTEFDSSYKRNEPVTFPINGVIPGWTEALQLMPVGSKWELYIPANLAYGEQAPPGIGPNSTLIFEVELLSIEKPEKADGKSEEKAGKSKK